MADRTEEAVLRTAGWACVAAALVVLALRLAAYWLTGSLAVLADAIEPLFNLAAAGVTLAGVVHGRRPADQDHPFGHRKLEFVAVGFQGAMVLAGAMVVAYAGWRQVASGSPIEPTALAVALFVFSIFVNAYVGGVVGRMGRRHNSPALLAAGRHAQLDIWVAAGVLINLVVVWSAGWRWLDPLVSVAVVLFVGYHALRLLRRAALGLMDTAGPRLRTIVAEELHGLLQPPIVGYHDLRCRDTGGHVFVDLHLQFADGTSLEAAHGVAEQVETAIEARVARSRSVMGTAEATVHLEPASEVREDRPHAPEGSDARRRAIHRAALTSLVVAIVLLAIKLTAAALTGSAAVLSDALESVVNVAAAGFALYSVRLARSGVDEDHPYGHHKVEFIAAAFEGALIAMAALLIMLTAVPRLFSGAEPQRLDLGLALVFGASLANAALGVYLLRAGRRLGSLTLEADGRHVLSDVWTSGGVLLGLTIVHLTALRGDPWAWADPAIAILVAVSLLHTGYTLLRRSLHGVLDTVDADSTARAAAVLDAELEAGRIVGWHQLRIRDSGVMWFIEGHVQLPEGTSLADAHTVVEEIEDALEAELSPGEAILHAEPASAVR